MAASACGAFSRRRRQAVRRAVDLSVVNQRHCAVEDLDERAEPRAGAQQRQQLRTSQDIDIAVAQVDRQHEVGPHVGRPDQVGEHDADLDGWAGARDFKGAMRARMELRLYSAFKCGSGRK